MYNPGQFYTSGYAPIPAMPQYGHHNQTQPSQQNLNGLSRSQKRGRNKNNTNNNGNNGNGQNNNNNNKKAKKSNNNNNKSGEVNLNHSSINKIAKAISNSNSTAEKQTKIRANIMIGSFKNTLGTIEAQKDFNTVYKRFINSKLRLFFSDGIDLPLHKVDDIQTQHLIVKFDASWFSDITRNASAMSNDKITTYQVFDAVYERVQTQLAKIKRHYAPEGVVFVVCYSGDIYDTVAGAVALDLALPIIQLGQHGKKAVDSSFTARDLAHRIMDVVKQYKDPVNLGNDDAPSGSSGIVNFDNL